MKFRLFDITGLFTPSAPITVRGTSDGGVPEPGMELRAASGLVAPVEAVEATTLPDDTPAWFLSVRTGSREGQARWLAALTAGSELELGACGNDPESAS